jgi:diguanylate cyclase (GGDEF)-like protein
MQILIVEDSPTLRAAMKSHVLKIGHQPVFAESGEEALQMVGVKEFDLVIMDVEMPGLDGFETTTLMREALGDRWVPIIFATSHTDDKSVLAGIEAGGDDYLIKPVTRGFLEAKIMAMQRIAEMHKQLSLLNTQLEERSETDSLTGLLNRRAFNEKVTQSLLEGRRHNEPSSLIMLDVDHFKPYNDTYGHTEGDHCLKMIADCIKNVPRRESDVIARYGGEEFIVFLPETGSEGAITVSETILSVICEQQLPHRTSPTADHVTISIGIATTTLAIDEDLESLIKRADKNLYRAKDNGRNQLACKPDIGHKTILIADDNPSNLSLLTRIFQPLGNIVTTENAYECIQMAKDLGPDLIMLDMDRSIINSEQTSAQLKDNLRTARIPVIYLSQEKSTEDTASDQICIAIPMDALKLRQQVETLIDA